MHRFLLSALLPADSCEERSRDPPRSLGAEQDGVSDPRSTTRAGSLVKAGTSLAPSLMGKVGEEERSEVPRATG